MGAAPSGPLESPRHPLSRRTPQGAHTARDSITRTLSVSLLVDRLLLPSPPQPPLALPFILRPQHNRGWQQVLSHRGLSGAQPGHLQEELEGTAGLAGTEALLRIPAAASARAPGQRKGVVLAGPEGWSGWEAWLETKGTRSQDPLERPSSPVSLSSASLPPGHCPQCES